MFNLKKSKKIKSEKFKRVCKTILRLAIAILILAAFCLAIYLPMHFTGVLKNINSANDIKEIILSTGTWGLVIFFLIQYLQVTVIPIPALVVTIAGTLIWGPWITTIISFVAILLGSITAFLLGRFAGNVVLKWIVGEDKSKKWSRKLGQGKYSFFLMMLFPVFPDDILCIIAGASDMSFKFFLITNLITRPIGIISTCFLSSGYLIPYHGWGIYVWAAMGLIILVLLILSFVYKHKIEELVTRVGKKRKKKA